MHAKMAAQKREFFERQQQAARTRAAVEQQQGCAAASRPTAPAAPAPRAAAPAADGPTVQVSERPPAQQRQRRQWQAPDTVQLSPRSSSQAGDEQPATGVGAAEGALTPEARRAVWEEMRAGAERNKRAAAQEHAGGGLAAFLGVPEDGREEAAEAAKRPQMLPSQANGGLPSRCVLRGGISVRLMHTHRNPRTGAP